MHGVAAVALRRAAWLLACAGAATADVCQISVRTSMEGTIEGSVAGSPTSAVPCAWHIKPDTWLEAVDFHARVSELHGSDRLSLYTSTLPSNRALAVSFSARHLIPQQFALTHTDEVLVVLSAQSNRTSFRLDYRCRPYGHKLGNYYFTPLVYVALMSILVLCGLSGLLLPSYLVCYYRAKRNQERALQESRLILHSELRRQARDRDQTLSQTMERRMMEALHQLPTELWHATESGEEQECCLCLDKFEEDDELRLLPCKHAFHKGCVDAWFAARRYMPRSCPLCKRNPIPAEAVASGGGGRNAGARPAPPAVSYGSARPAAEDAEDPYSSAQEEVISNLSHESVISGDRARDPPGVPRGLPGYVPEAA